jgi:hypothetical protein
VRGLEVPSANREDVKVRRLVLQPNLWLLCKPLQRILHKVGRRRVCGLQSSPALSNAAAMIVFFY